MTCYRTIFEFVTLPASASVGDAYQSLLAYFREAFVALLSFRFPELFNHILSFAVPLSRKRALPAELWADILAVVTVRFMRWGLKRCVHLCGSHSMHSVRT
jgi:hypothetical protein